jgi:copper chaperone CopZ
MNIKLIARVTPEGQLEIPGEILQQLQPLTEDEISLTENEIKLTKKQNKLTLEQLFQRVDEAEPDPSAPSLAEISQIVKEVRQELW